jgi:hypothetical protein
MGWSDDEILPFPVYHGTSTLFEASIRQSGLGGRNPIHDYDVLAFLIAVMNECNTDPSNPGIPPGEWQFMEDILEQSPLRGNWRHGSVYLTPSFARARNHACHQDYGSELISFAHQYYRLLKTRAPNVRIRGWAELRRLLRRKPRPLLIEVAQIRISQLRAENGGDAALELMRMEKLGNICRPEILQSDFCSIPIGFELKGVLPADVLVFQYTPTLSESLADDSDED